MSKKQHHRSAKDHPKWPLVGAVVAILLGMMWNDQRQETREIQSCGLVMSESAMMGDAGWGMFALKPIQSSAPVHGDVTIQLPDVTVEYHAQLDVLLEQYAWLAHAGGGIFEGYAVHSIMPGIGSLANGHPGLANVIEPSKIDIDHGTVTRDKFPGAGAITHYTKVLWKATQTIAAGDEIIVDYGLNWRDNVKYSNQEKPQKTVKELKSNGICLDNIRPQQSNIVGAGRGAFAARFLPKGSIIAPAPLITIPSKDAFKMTQFITNSTTGEREFIFGHQLLLNYCFSHTNSSLLFFPYSPTVNLINHDSEKPNAKLQWSTSPLHYGKEWLNDSIDKIKQLDRTGLLLEFVATRDIEMGEEILIDYGEEWQEAWNKHVATWEPQFVDDYEYPSRLDQQEELSMEYPENIMTACHYSFAERAPEVATNAQLTVVWEQRKKTIKKDSLRPCKLLHKQVDPSTGKVSYTAEMLNNDVTTPKEKVPDGKFDRGCCCVLVHCLELVSFSHQDSVSRFTPIARTIILHPQECSILSQVYLEKQSWSRTSPIIRISICQTPFDMRLAFRPRSFLDSGWIYQSNEFSKWM